MKLFKSFLVCCSLVAVLAHSDEIQVKKENSVAVSLHYESCFGKPGYEATFVDIPDKSSGISTGEFSEYLTQNFNTACLLEKSIRIVGAITPATVIKFKYALELIKQRSKDGKAHGGTVYLHSKSGSVYSAMEIGTLLADNLMSTTLLFNPVCDGPCVLTFAAGTTRIGGAPLTGNKSGLGLSRPYVKGISIEGLAYTEYLSKTEQVTSDLKKYLSNYGVSPLLVDVMNTVPSDEVRYLEPRYVMTKYGLGDKNIAYEEYQKARTIQICGQEFHDESHLYWKLQSECQIRSNLKGYQQRFDMCSAELAPNFPNFNFKTEKCNELKAKKL